MPDRANIHFVYNDLKFATKLGKFSISFQAFDSECLGELRSENNIENHEASHIINLIIKNLVYRLSFINACSYDFEIVSIRNINTGSADFITVFEPFLFEQFEQMTNYGHTQHGYLIVPNGPRVGQQMIDVALRLFNHAMRDKALTPLFCYMAIESPAYGFSEIDDKITPKQLKADDWKKFRQKLSISEITIKDKIKPLADEMRHGKLSDTSWKNRKECLSLTWEIISRAMKRLRLGDPESYKEI